MVDVCLNRGEEKRKKSYLSIFLHHHFQKKKRKKEYHVPFCCWEIFFFKFVSFFLNVIYDLRILCIFSLSLCMKWHGEREKIFFFHLTHQQKNNLPFVLGENVFSLSLWWYHHYHQGIKKKKKKKERVNKHTYIHFTNKHFSRSLLLAEHYHHHLGKRRRWKHLQLCFFCMFWEVCVCVVGINVCFNDLNWRC